MKHNDELDESISAAEGYRLYRGTCQELCANAICVDPTLTLVRGHYFCPVWCTNEPHWWCVRADGSIYDPSRLQFPSKGHGTYEPFTGMVECAQCGKEIKEEDADFESNYAFCSYQCLGRFIGVF